MKRPTAAATARYAALLLGSFAISCSQAAPEPEAVPVDSVNCARCGMMVSSEPRSAQWVVPGEETRFYDDIGCLAAEARSRGESGARFVHVEEGRWARAETAFYARPANESTPMGYGVVAFSNRAEAASRDRQARARSWDELVAELPSERPEEGARP
jgi:hypothetical protein